MEVKADRRSRHPSWNGPRTVLVPRTDRGFGFTLRHFIVYPPESATKDKFKEREYISEDDAEELYFERIQHGNLDPLDTIFVKNVKEGGPAQQAGLNPGDRIISVNGEPVTGKSYGQVINLIQNSNSDLSLLVVPKDEDILQLAYESSAKSIDSDYGLAGESTGSSLFDPSRHYPPFPQPYTPPMDSISHSASSSSSRDRKLVSSSTSNLDYRNSDSVPSSRYGIDREPRRSLTSSTSYTSGLSIYHEPPPNYNEEAMNRALFLDRKREFENRAAQENVNPQTKTYSFGLYYPKANKESRVNSAESLARPVVIRRSRENVLQPTDSQENISKCHRTPRVRNVPVEYRHSGTPDDKVSERFRSQESLRHDSDVKPSVHHGSGSAIRHSFPDSDVQVWSSPTRHVSDTTNPYSFEHGTPTPESNSKRDSYPASRQYVPVINQSAMSPQNSKMSGSVDSIDPRSNVFHSEQYLRTAYNSPGPEQSNQNSSRTFIVKIGDRQSDMNKRSSTPNISHDSPNSSNQSYGTAFAITRSPAAEIEIRKNEPRILVSHRKKHFEHSNSEVTSPTSNNGSVNRFRTEIKKEPFRKFDSIAQRVASFERQTSEQNSRSRSQTPTSQPNNKVRRMSQERTKSPEPAQNGSHSQGSFTDSAQIRIYVSQGNSNKSGSPIVEIVPMPASYDPSDSRGRQIESHAHPDEVDGQVPENGREAEGEGQKPVRKASFLSAVNAPYSRYLPQTGYEHETPSPETPPKSSRVLLPASQNAARSASQTPTNFSWAARSQSPANAISPTSLGSSSNIAITATSITTTPVRDSTSTVRLRNKPEISAEDYETKLHRRTSYLMATAKDKSTASLTMSPTMQLDPNTPAAFSKHKSMRKLKDFFGEKTPKILEAQEKKADPASPIQTVIKEGSLGYKVDLIDGKRASDRSWRPVWAVLRGHALYLYKDKRDQGGVPLVVHALTVKVGIGAQQTNMFAYDEQPISVKASIVDIAHGYTKKKNVFRLQTYNMSEYLFQAEDQEAMMSWIDAIKRNNNPDKDSNGVASAELIIRKSQELECAPPISTKTSPPASQKLNKKTSVLSIKPKVMASPNAKHRKTSTEKDDTKQKNWKNKLGKSIKKHIGSSPSPTIQTVQEVGGMFGVPLDLCTPSPNNEFVPLIVDMCTQIVEAKGLEMTGVYRIPGNKAAVTSLQEEFNKGIESMNLDHEKWSDVNVISSLLKSFFRQLPEPLVTDELYQPFIDANRIENPERRMLKLKRLIHELPEHHFETFKHLAKHLNRVAVYGDVNRMEAKNLAIVFGPTLIRTTNDNMAAMFTDMSDHCKIIESIILHCDWFFGSWDMDNYVPTDDDATECTSITSALTSSTREDLDNVSINPQAIVTNIVEAANRKLRGEPPLQRSSADSPSKFSERNIDQEIALRTRKIDITSRSSPNISAMQRNPEIMSQSAQEISGDRRMAKSQEFCDREFSDFDFIDADKEPTSPIAVNRFLSEDSMLDRNDELEFSHSSHSSNYRLSRETLDSLRRIEFEARALREREERRQRDLEKRKLEKQRIEQDILQTQQELENEDQHSVEDLLNAPEYSPWMSPDYYKRKHDAGQARDSGSRDYKSQKYGSGSQNSMTRDSPSGGKYFVIKGNAATSTPYDRNSRPPRQANVESLSVPSKRTSSLENMADSYSRSKGRPMAHVRGARKVDSDKSKRDSAEIKRSNGRLSRSNSIRRGSLDSLIDLIEKRDNRASWASTDSDESFDLLTTLTTTFDKKLQTLSSPKLIQTTAPPVPRRQPYNSSLNSVNTAISDSSDSSSQNAQRRLPPQVPLSMINRSGGSNSDLHSKQYRDPSLHRTPPKPDAKIGLATRFERSTTYNPTYQAPQESSLNVVTGNSGVDLTSDITFAVDSAHLGGIRNNPRTEARVSSVMVVTPSPSVMSADSQQGGTYVTSHFISSPAVSSVALPPKRDSQTSQTSQSGLNQPGLRTDYRPISKSEKTEVNVKLSQISDKNKNVNKSLVLTSNKDNQNVNTVKSRSESPPPTSSRKKTEKRKKRRHTVGGTNDGEHMKAMSELTGSPTRRSAWDQLQPAVGDQSVVGPNSSMLTWIRNERLRGSSPDLSASRFDKSTSRRN